jgi:hypothetical protein
MFVEHRQRWAERDAAIDGRGHLHHDVGTIIVWHEGPLLSQ